MTGEPHETDVLLIGAHGGRMIPVCTDLAREAHQLAAKLREYEQRNGQHRSDLDPPSLDDLRTCVGDLLDLSIHLAHRAHSHGLLADRHQPLTTIPRPPH